MIKCMYGIHASARNLLSSFVTTVIQHSLHSHECSGCYEAGHLNEAPLYPKFKKESNNLVNGSAATKCKLRFIPRKPHDFLSSTYTALPFRITVKTRWPANACSVCSILTCTSNLYLHFKLTGLYIAGSSCWMFRD
jgi:hypothetical protein